MLVEGNSLRSTSRMTDVSINTVTKLLRGRGRGVRAVSGQGAPRSQVQADSVRRDLVASSTPRRRTSPSEHAGRVGRRRRVDVDRDRRRHEACAFVGGRSARRGHGAGVHWRPRLALAHRVQLTTDGHKAYLEAVEDAFGADVDYAMLIKLYGRLGQERARRATAPPMHGHARDDHRRPRPGAHQHQLRRAPEPHDADEHAAVHAADQRILKEG